MTKREHAKSETKANTTYNDNNITYNGVMATYDSLNAKITYNDGPYVVKKYKHSEE